MAKKSRRPLEPVNGSYTPAPHRVLDSKAFTGCSPRAKALLFELLRQHNGSNNGHIQLSHKWLEKRGWTSRDQVAKGKAELIERGLILQTRQGGLGIGPSRFALTWVIITNFNDLDIKKSQYHPGAWVLLDPPPTIPKRGDQTAMRYSTVPQHGKEDRTPVPQHGTKNVVFGDAPVPPCGNNEVYHPPPDCSATTSETGLLPSTTVSHVGLESSGVGHSLRDLTATIWS